MQKWNTANIPDQSGKLVIVTGANSGLGYETSLALAAKNAEVIMACRNPQKAQSAFDKIKSEVPNANLVLMQLDLGSLDSVRSFADEVHAKYNHIDLLINNAGVMVPPYGKTVDGFETQFGVNHLGHFALTAQLLDLLFAAENSRIVNVSSQAHNMGQINFDDLQSEKKYIAWTAYGQSKIANLYFTYELQRKLATAGKTTIAAAAHPGYAATNLQESSGFFKVLNIIMAQSAAMGALPSLFAATNPEVKGADYFGPHAMGGWRGYPIKVKSNKLSYNEAIAAQLWEVSEELTGIKFNL
jgi:NAD(P)-dependent dehydrogenase (short-subunit alcohol dehydrogenase family)